MLRRQFLIPYRKNHGKGGKKDFLYLVNLYSKTRNDILNEASTTFLNRIGN